MSTRLKKPIALSGAWLSRVFSKWFIGLLAITGVLDVLALLLPRNDMYPILREFLENGTNWQWSIVVLGLAFIISNFLIFRDSQDEIEGLRRRIKELEEKEPSIDVGFQDESGRLVKSLQFQLLPVAPLPDLDALVREEDAQLIPKKQEKRPSKIQDLAFAEITSKPNPHFQQEREEHLVKYRNYLIKRYEHDISPFRSFLVSPIAENRADYPANDVQIKLVMPAVYQKAEEHQRYCLSKEEEKELGEELKELKIQHVCGKPRRPTPIINDNLVIRPPHLDDRSYPPLPLPSDDYPLSNTSGPDYAERDGHTHISYHAKALVQHRPESDFSPFSLWLGNIVNPTVWEFAVEITSADLRKPQTELLKIEIIMGKESVKSSSN